MTTSARSTSELAITLRLTEQAKAKLAQRAAENGQELADYASQLIEQTIIKPTVDEVLAPFRNEVAQSNMSDDQLDAFHEELRERVWRDNQARNK